MKFEFVEFYPIKKPRNNQVKGTVHIYAIDCDLDIRGIAVHVHGKAMYFNFPHYSAIDEETGNVVRYPHIRWTNEEKHQSMMDFLHKEVKPKVWESLKKQELK
jgi:hypothetical protein